MEGYKKKIFLFYKEENDLELTYAKVSRYILFLKGKGLSSKDEKELEYVNETVYSFKYYCI